MALFRIIITKAVGNEKSRPKSGLLGRVGGPRRGCARRTGTLRGWRPISFRGKETGERKGGEGNFSFPSPLPSKRAAFLGGRPICGCCMIVSSLASSLIIGVTCLAWQYNATLIGRKPPPKWHRTGAIPPQEKLSRDAHWGECRGGSVPSALSFPPLSFAKKAVPPLGKRPVR